MRRQMNGSKNLKNKTQKRTKTMSKNEEPEDNPIPLDPYDDWPDDDDGSLEFDPFKEDE